MYSSLFIYWRILGSFINKSWQNDILSDICLIEVLVSRRKDVFNNPGAWVKEIKCQKAVFLGHRYIHSGDLCLNMAHWQLTIFNSSKTTGLILPPDLICIGIIIKGVKTAGNDLPLFSRDERQGQSLTKKILIYFHMNI